MVCSLIRGYKVQGLLVTRRNGLSRQPASMGGGTRAHPQDEGAARTWINPLLKKLKAGRAACLLNDLHALAKRLRKKQRQAIESIWKATGSEWTTGRHGVLANRKAAVRWNQPADNTSVDSSVPVSSGVALGMNA